MTFWKCGFNDLLKNVCICGSPDYLYTETQSSATHRLGTTTSVGVKTVDWHFYLARLNISASDTKLLKLFLTTRVSTDVSWLYYDNRQWTNMIVRFSARSEVWSQTIEKPTLKCPLVSSLTIVLGSNVSVPSTSSPEAWSVRSWLRFWFLSRPRTTKSSSGSAVLFGERGLNLTIDCSSGRSDTHETEPSEETRKFEAKSAREEKRSGRRRSGGEHAFLALYNQNRVISKCLDPSLRRYSLFGSILLMLQGFFSANLFKKYCQSNCYV